MPTTRLPLLLAAALVAATPAGTASASGGGGGEGGGLHLVEMTPLVVPIVEGDRMVGRLRVKLVLDATDAPGAVKVTAELPMLRERGLAELSEYARLYASPFTVVDATRLAADITAGLHETDHTVARVLLVEVSATPA